MTVTDPDGNVTTFERSEYVGEHGETAIGPGGGRVRGPAGTGIELRVPAGATPRGVTLKLTPFAADHPAAAVLPDFGEDDNGQPRAHFASGLQIESQDRPAFNKEVDLVFPLPDFAALPEEQRPAQPQDAFYYVVRRLVGDCLDPNPSVPRSLRHGPSPQLM